jgi:hypothetical protein
MLVRFSDLPDSARVWTFAASRPLGDQEAQAFLAATEKFLGAWTAHKVPLATACEWRFNQFLFVGVDEAATGASGCSIDALVHFMQDAERRLEARLTDNGRVWFRDAAGAVQCVTRSRFHELAEADAVGAETTVFDNTIETVGALREGRWEVPARNSWHARAFELKGASA